MSNQRISAPRGGRFRVAAVAALTLAGSAAGLGPAHAATPAPQSHPRSGQSAPVAKTSQPTGLTPIPNATGVSAADRLAMQRAATAARSSGKPVVVDALTDPTTEVVASPKGGMSLTANALPVRARQAGAWVPVSTRLHRSGDGRLTPTATAYASVSFSAGGSGPLAVTRSGGVTVRVSWPTALPAPVVSQSSATYRSALPGVDLVVAATPSGGFSETLVIHSRQAAESPALASLRLGTQVTGGHLVAGAAGGLTVVDTRGRKVMDAPTPLQWDSNTVLPAAPRGSRAAAASQAVKVAADASDAGHAGLAARVAPVHLKANASSLTLVPNAAMVAARNTVYPLYEDPTFNWHPNSPAAPAFDEVKQGCPGDSFYNQTGVLEDDGNLGVGYNGWQEGQCYTGDEHALYQWNLGSTLWGAAISTATVNATDLYSASCATTATVNLHWSGGMGSGVDWSNRPGYHTWSTSASFGPAYNAKYCPGNGSTSNGFGVQPVIQALSNQHARTFTATLSEDSMESSYNRNGFKRFANNPTLQVFFNNPPNNPTRETMAAVSGADDAACSTTAPGPFMGKTIGTTTPILRAKVSDPNGDKLQATFQYWIDGTSTKYTGLSGDNLNSGSYAAYSLPASFVSSLTNGKVVDWDVKVTDGQAWSSYAGSPTCHFDAEPTAPDTPTVTSENNLYPDTDVNDATVGAPYGTTGTFDVASAGTTATKFVYNLDEPPTTTAPLSTQTVTASASAAKIKVTPLSPGPHTLYVYAVDAAGDDSGEFAYPFLAAGHANVSCASFTSCLNNKAISMDTDVVHGNADGYASFSGNDLANAGWASGGNVTVDGADFTLPAYGGTAQMDNVLAANQTITMPGSGNTGNALVLLATSTRSTMADPGAIPNDATAPYVPAGIAISGSYCFIGTTPTGVCPATGTITYTNGTTVGYTLTVPDWNSGPQSLAAITLPHLNEITGQVTSSTHQPKLYPFAIPTDPNLTVASVTLPDVSSDQAGIYTQGLHIFGMAMRNTTSSTPRADGSTTTLATGQSWTGAWANPNEGAYNFQGGSFSNQTFRIALKPSLSGGTVRVKLDNALGTNTIDVNHATIALSSNANSPSAVPSGTPQQLTFGPGWGSYWIPVGGSAYSNPISLNVTAGQYLLVSFQISSTTPYMVQHSYANGSYTYISATGSGDKTTDTTGTPFSGTGTLQGNFTDLLTGLDVQSANTPTEAVLGDNLTDPFQPNTTLPNSNGYRVSDALAAAEPTTPAPYGVLAEGIESNQLMDDNPETYNGSTIGGPAALSRIDRDILDQPGVNTVVVTEGLEDLLNGPTTDTDLEANGYQALVQQLQAWNINVVLTSLTPCAGFAGDGATPNDPCTTGTPTSVDTYRTDVNTYLSGVNLGNPWGTPAVYFADFDAAVAVTDSSGIEKLATAADGGDHVNLSTPAYGALATTVLSPQDAWNLSDGQGLAVATDTASTDNLNTPSTVTNPNTGNNPLTLNTGATWATDATRGTVLNLDGTTGDTATATTGVLNTAGSYSISAWVKMTNTTTYNTIAAQAGTNSDAFYLQYSKAYNAWAFISPSSDSTTPTSFPHAAASSAPALNTWTHLVGTYNNATNTMSLYVNGTLAGTGTNTTPWAATGALHVGSAGASNFFPGQISNVQAFNYALTPNQITALNQQIQ